jgi:uncharacterized protein (DUF1330 family)
MPRLPGKFDGTAASHRTNARANVTRSFGRSITHKGGDTMAKAYWITTYRNISNPDALAEYAKLAAPAIQSGGGRFVVRGMPAKTYEAGLNQRTVIIEFDSVERAVAAHDSDGYKAALKALGNAAERDIRIVEGV